MISLPDGLEDALHDEVPADLALLRGLLEARVQVVLLTVHLAIHIVESLATESPATGTTDKTRGVIQVTHSLVRTQILVIMDCPVSQEIIGNIVIRRSRMSLLITNFLTYFGNSGNITRHVSIMGKYFLANSCNS